MKPHLDCTHCRRSRAILEEQGPKGMVPQPDGSLATNMGITAPASSMPIKWPPGEIMACPCDCHDTWKQFALTAEQRAQCA